MHVTNISILASPTNEVLYNFTTPVNITVEQAASDFDYGFFGADVGDPTGTNFNIASIDSANILNLEACGKYVFAEEIFYDFTVQVGGGNISDTVMLQFTDGVINMTVLWDNIRGIGKVVVGRDNIALGTVSTILNTAINQIDVTFPIFFKRPVLDTLNVDLLAWANDTLGTVTGWINIAPNEFNIYSEIIKYFFSKNIFPACFQI